MARGWQEYNILGPASNRPKPDLPPNSLSNLVMEYKESEISILALFVMGPGIIQSQRWAWAGLITIGSAWILAYIPSAASGNARWQVNVLLSVLHVVGTGLAGGSLFKRSRLMIQIAIYVRSTQKAPADSEGASLCILAIARARTAGRNLYPHT